MTSLLFVPAAVLGSCAFALSSRLKHSASRPDAQAPTASWGWLRNPRYLQGIVADAAGLVLQVLALRLGPLAGVQPLMICSLVFALAFESGRRRIHEVKWAIAIVAGLAAFTVLARTTRGAPAIDVDRGAAIVLAVVAVATASLCLATASRLGPRSRVLLLAAVAGTTYAVSAALMKSLTALAAFGVTAVLEGWQLYALIVVGGAGLILTQRAFASGPLSASLPTMAVVDPLVSVIIGIAVFGEQVRSSPMILAGLAMIGVLLAVAVVRLSRSRAESGVGAVSAGPRSA